MQYDRVFPVAMPGELQITPFCAPQRMDAEIPEAAHSGGYLSVDSAAAWLLQVCGAAAGGH